MKLEIGKAYVTRDSGTKKTITRIAHDPLDPTGIAYAQEGGAWWASTGRANLSRDGDGDLVAEYVEPVQVGTLAPPTVKHADLIRAVLDGAKVQWNDMGQWITIHNPNTGISNMISHPQYEYRLLPKPKVHYCPLYAPVEGENGWWVADAYTSLLAAAGQVHNGEYPVAVYEITQDLDTHEATIKTIHSKDFPK